MANQSIPKYEINNSVDISDYNDEDVYKIVQDLNDNGYLVYVESEELMRMGFGVFNGNVVNKNCEVTIEACDFETYLDGEHQIICVMQSAANLAKLRKIKPKRVISLGHTDNGDYEILLENNRLKIGCQEINKENAIAMARKILKEYKS